MQKRHYTDAERIGFLLGRLQHRVEKRVDRGKLKLDLMESGDHVKVKLDGQLLKFPTDPETLPLEAENLDEYLDAPNGKEKDNSERVIEDFLVRKIQEQFLP